MNLKTIKSALFVFIICLCSLTKIAGAAGEKTSQKAPKIEILVGYEFREKVLVDSNFYNSEYKVIKRDFSKPLYLVGKDSLYKLKKISDKGRNGSNASSDDPFYELNSNNPNSAVFETTNPEYLRNAVLRTADANAELYFTSQVYNFLIESVVVPAQNPDNLSKIKSIINKLKSDIVNDPLKPLSKNNAVDVVNILVQFIKSKNDSLNIREINEKDSVDEKSRIFGIVANEMKNSNDLLTHMTGNTSHDIIFGNYERSKAFLIMTDEKIKSFKWTPINKMASCPEQKTPEYNFTPPQKRQFCYNFLKPSQILLVEKLFGNSVEDFIAGKCGNNCVNDRGRVGVIDNKSYSLLLDNIRDTGETGGGRTDEVNMDPVGVLNVNNDFWLIYSGSDTDESFEYYSLKFDPSKPDFLPVINETIIGWGN